MTVKELKRALRDYDDNAPVYIIRDYDDVVDGNFQNIDEVTDVGLQVEVIEAGLDFEDVQQVLLFGE